MKALGIFNSFSLTVPILYLLAGYHWFGLDRVTISLLLILTVLLNILIKLSDIHQTLKKNLKKNQ